MPLRWWRGTLQDKIFAMEDLRHFTTGFKDEPEEIFLTKNKLAIMGQQEGKDRLHVLFNFFAME
jgi:hypothetical protein